MIGTAQETHTEFVTPSSIKAEHGRPEPNRKYQITLFGSVDAATGVDAITHWIFISAEQAKELAARLDELVSEE